MRISYLILCFVAFSPLCSAEQPIRYEFIGAINSESVENTVLEVSFSNTGSSTICLEDWVVDRGGNAGMYRDVLLLYSESGDLLQTKTHSAQFASEDQVNSFVYYVKPKASISASYNLTDLYDLKPGAFSVTMFLDIALCSDYLAGVSEMESSNNLKYLSVVKSMDVVELNHFFVKSGNRIESAQVVALPLLSFELP